MSSYFHTTPKPITAFDFAPYAAASYGSIMAYTLEGSADGQHWYEVAKDDDVNYTHTLGNNSRWIYTQRNDDVTKEANTRKIRLLADGETKALTYTCETNDYSVLEYVGVVSVVAGATLKAEGDFLPEIRHLGVDAQTGAGTIEGFKLVNGADITVNGTFPKGSFTVPVSFGGVSNVTAAVWLSVKDASGRKRAGSVTLTESSLTFVPDGLILMVR